jgi:hypothetical protein
MESPNPLLPIQLRKVVRKTEELSLRLNDVPNQSIQAS